MKRAFAIRVAGDVDLATSIAKPLQSQELDLVRAELAATQEELARIKAEKDKAENAELGVRRACDKKKYGPKIRSSRRKYSVRRKRTKAEDAVLVGWALLWLGIFAASDKLRRWNRS